MSSCNKGRVWLILAQVRVLSENPANLVVGSEAIVQCFIPEVKLEVALRKTDDVLAEEGMQRIDVLSCCSYDTDEDENNIADFVKQDIAQARQTGVACTGTFITSKISAKFKPD